MQKTYPKETSGSGLRLWLSLCLCRPCQQSLAWAQSIAIRTRTAGQFQVLQRGASQSSKPSRSVLHPLQWRLSRWLAPAPPFYFISIGFLFWMEFWLLVSLVFKLNTESLWWLCKSILKNGSRVLKGRVVSSNALWENSLIQVRSMR